MRIKVGQVWTYDNRPGEDESRATILKLDDSKDGSMIVHINVSGIKINNPDSNENIEEITHMPFVIEAIGTSLLELVGESELPDYLEGYNAWKREYGNGNAGVFSESIGESVKFMDKTVNG